MAMSTVRNEQGHSCAFYVSDRWAVFFSLWVVVVDFLPCLVYNGTIVHKTHTCETIVYQSWIWPRFQTFALCLGKYVVPLSMISATGSQHSAFCAYEFKYVRYWSNEIGSQGDGVRSCVPLVSVYLSTVPSGFTLLYVAGVRFPLHLKAE